MFKNQTVSSIKNALETILHQRDCLAKHKNKIRCIIFFLVIYILECINIYGILIKKYNPQQYVAIKKTRISGALTTQQQNGSRSATVSCAAKIS